jgi:HEAT repeat protein
MTSINNLPEQLIHFLREHLLPDNIHIIADDYGERNGHWESLYDQLVKRAGIQQVPRVLVLHAVVRRDVMGLVHLITGHYPELQEKLHTLGFETMALTQSYLATLQQEIQHAKEREVQPETFHYFISQTNISPSLPQNQPLDFTLLLQATSETAPRTVLTQVNLNELLTTHQYVILSHWERATTANILRSLALRMIEDWQCAPTHAKIPVLVPLEQWLNLKLDMHQFLQVHMAWLGVPQFAEVLPDLLHAGKVVLLMEGLDALPFAQRDKLTGLLTDARVLSMTQLSEKHQWWKARCVLSCRVKDFLSDPHWQEVHVLDPARELQPQLSDNPAFTLRNHIDSIFGQAAGQFPDGVTGSELQTYLGRLAFNVVYTEISLRYRSDTLLSKDKPARVDRQTAAAWLFYLQELNNLEMEPELQAEQKELQQAEQIFHWAEAVGLLTRGEVRDPNRPSRSGKPGIYFPNESIKSYLCLHYCLSHMRENLRLINRLQSSYAREAWWLWKASNPELIEKLLLLLRSSEKEIRSDVARILCWCGDRAAVEPLIVLCNDTEADVRSAAAFALGKLRDHRAIQPLLNLLQDMDLDVRRDAVYALGAFDDERVVPALTQALEDENRDVARASAYTLGKIGDVRVVTALISALSDERTSSVAKNGLVKLGIVAVPALIETLIEKSPFRATNERKHDAVYDIVEMLGDIGDVRPLPILMWLVEHDERENRYGGKVRYAAKKAMQEIQKRHCLAMLLLTALHRGEADLSAGAMFALALLGDKRAVEPLIQALQDKKVYLRWGAARLLGRFGDERAIVPLVATMRDTERRVRQSASAALAALHKSGASVVTFLLPLLEDTNSDLRQETVQLLADIRSQKAVEPLIATLSSDPSHRVRSAAVIALGRIGDKRALEPLMAAANDPDTEVRKSVGEAVNKIDPEQSIHILIAALQDEDVDIRGQAARDLVRYGDRRAVEPLIAALKDPDGWVRECAVYALRFYGGIRALEPLIELLQNETGVAAWAASEALAALGDHRAIVPIIATLAKSEGRYSAILAEALLSFGAAITQPLIDALEDQGPEDPIYYQEIWSQEFLQQRMGWRYFDGNPHLRCRAEMHYHAADLFGKVGDVRALPVLMWMAAKDYSITEKERISRGAARDSFRPWQQEEESASVAATQAIDTFLRSWQQEEEAKRREESASVAAAQAIDTLLQRNSSPERLAVLLDSEDSAVRLGATFALGEYHDTRAIPGLIEALKQDDRRVRWGAARLLDGFSSYRKVAPLIAALEDEDTDVLSMAAHALSRCGKVAIHPLIVVFKAGNSSQCVWAARALIEMGRPAVRPLLVALRNESDVIHDWIAYVLGGIGKPAVLPLIAALKEKRSDVRYWAALALGDIGDGRAIQPLTALLNGGNVLARVCAAIALAKMGNARASEQLIAFLEHKKPIVRFLVIERLGGIEHLHSRAIKPLIMALMDEVKEIRLAAIAALGELGDSNALYAMEMIAGRIIFPEMTLAKKPQLSILSSISSETDIWPPTVDESDLLIEDYNQAQALHDAAWEAVDEPDLFFSNADWEDPFPDASPIIEKPPSALPENDVTWWINPTNLSLATPQEEAPQESDITQKLVELANAIKQKPETYLLDKDIQDTTSEAIKRLEARGINTYEECNR